MPKPTGRHRSGDQPSDSKGRTIPGRTRDRARGADEDHGAPHEVTGRRAAKRIRTGSFRVGILGGIHNDRGSNAPEWRDRIRGA